MELALLLVFVVLVELALTFFLLGRINDYRKRVSSLEKNVRELSNVVSSWSEDKNVAFDTEGQANDFASLLENVTEEDIQQAQTVLAAMGVRKH